MSDGYICKTPYSFQVGISLQKEDSYILEKLKEEMKSTAKISEYKNSNKIVFTGSEHLFNVLKSYGFSENKSHKDYTIPNIPRQFINSFVRGYFDGDGCITIKSTGYVVISICCNSKIFLDSLCNVLTNEFDIPDIRVKQEQGKRKIHYMFYILQKRVINYCLKTLYIKVMK